MVYLFLFIVIILFKVQVLIMLFVVVSLVMVLVVERLLFLYRILLALPAGILAPPYHLDHFSFYCDYFAQNSGSHYVIRGGRSNYGLRCGAFCISSSYSASTADWNVGAALSFKPYIYILFLSK